jgi:hypothetical protein
VGVQAQVRSGNACIMLTPRRYCDAACAKAHWKHHKAGCRRAAAAAAAAATGQEAGQQQQ